MTRQPCAAALWICAFLMVDSAVHAHDGPPFPIVSNQIAGAYRVSVWTDPDATDDGSLGGQFWVMIDPAAPGARLPQDVRARVSIRPLDRQGPGLDAPAEPVGGDRSRQYAELLMDHEGLFAVHVAIESSAGDATVESHVEATYDLRPPPVMLLVYLVPFLLAGGLWAKVLLRRRGLRRGAAA